MQYPEAERPEMPEYVDMNERRWRVVPSKIQGAYGCADYNNRTVTINPDTNMSMTDEIDTLVHELLHVVWYEMGIRAKKEANEEYVVTMLARGITQLMLRNIHLVEYFVHATLHERAARQYEDEGGEDEEYED